MSVVCGALDHICQRIDYCAFVETKTFCVSCKAHCYRPQMREQIRTVMRYAGLRMMFYYPCDGYPASDENKKEKGFLQILTETAQVAVRIIFV